MKVWPLGVLAFVAGCGAAPPVPEYVYEKPAPAPSVPRVKVAPAPDTSLPSESRAFADRLRAEPDYHPAATGGQCVSAYFELAPGAYIAQGWPWEYVCHLSKPRPCAQAWLPPCDSRPFYSRRTPYPCR